MCGSRETPLLKLKAAKSKVLLGWFIDVLKHQGGSSFLGDEGRELLKCSENIAEIYAVLARESRVLPDDAFPQLDRACRAACEAWMAAGGVMTMKWHILAKHLTNQMRLAGSTLWSHNYKDESENFSTRERGNYLNRRSFNENVLAKWLVDYLSTECL